MDLRTRYSVSAIVPDTRMEAGIIALDYHWISTIWAPNFIQFDQAFSYQEFENYLDLHGISARPIPASRHNKNGLESKDKIIRDIFLRISPNACNETIAAQQIIRISMAMMYALLSSWKKDSLGH